MNIGDHCIWHQEEEASKLTLCQPLHGRRAVLKKRTCYVDAGLHDTGLSNAKELRTAMTH